jgi:hypothetical protein
MLFALPMISKSFAGCVARKSIERPFRSMPSRRAGRREQRGGYDRERSQN